MGRAQMKTTPSKKNKSKQKDKGLFITLVIALCLCLALGGSVYTYQRHLHNVRLIQKELAAAEIKAREERIKRRSEIQALFDAYLNAFKSELFEKTKTYKKNRKLLKNLTRPVNYTDTASAKENYTLFKESLAPTLRKQSERVINIFEQYSSKVRKELAGDESDLQKTFLSQWEDMAREQLAHYIDFFAREEALIQAYDKLITFYYSHSKRYVVNDLGTGLEFSNPDDEEKAQFLLKRVKELQVPKKKAEKKAVTNSNTD